MAAGSLTASLRLLKCNAVAVCNLFRGIPPEPRWNDGSLTSYCASRVASAHSHTSSAVHGVVLVRNLRHPSRTLLLTEHISKEWLQGGVEYVIQLGLVTNSFAALNEYAHDHWRRI